VIHYQSELMSNVSVQQCHMNGITMFTYNKYILFWKRNTGSCRKL